MNQLKIVFNPIEGKFDYISEGSGAFQRILARNLTLLNGESLVVSDYIDMNGHNIDLQGDSVLDIIG